ncbi:MAG: acetyl-CoA carboxylase biotin carboxylase subunit [Schleiferiaceae bacterium]|nr:acetyl-CoA carboxylase biotin carboxylase subunit [Schleiferiaceae bacterium]
MKKILVANRGEIALRVMRTAKEMGISTVAVFSEADRNAVHVRFADEAVCIGPAPSNQSYLLGDKIIEVCKELNVDAIHPGYGFLSENAGFAKLCEDAGVIFIGPTPHAISVMGDKLSAKHAVKDFEVPQVPGGDGEVKDIAAGKELAKEIGFPVLIKASAGGGGKGMRVVEKVEDFEEQMALAVSEATSAFGNGAVFVEKYITNPRHIEIQIMADSHGNVCHLFERDCSVQRRHQKVVEEAPSAVLTPEKREAMGKAAIEVARSVDYTGAGTVEFIYTEDHQFYFLEMNTRLQVEHPVTEMVSGIDLVREQIRVAEGHELSFKQEDLKINGHSMEVRVYAENPWENFSPDIGTLDVYSRPLGPGVRVDDGFEQGMEVPIYYDPMISKLVTHGENREEAMDRMIRAIDEYRVLGVETTLPFGKYVMQHEAFRSGNFSTNFVNVHFDAEKLSAVKNDELEMAAIFASKLLQDDADKDRFNNKVNEPSNWKRNRTL